MLFFLDMMLQMLHILTNRNKISSVFIWATTRPSKMEQNLLLHHKFNAYIMEYCLTMFVFNPLMSFGYLRH